MAAENMTSFVDAIQQLLGEFQCEKDITTPIDAILMLGEVYYVDLSNGKKHKGKLILTYDDNEFEYVFKLKLKKQEPINLDAFQVVICCYKSDSEATRFQASLKF